MANHPQREQALQRCLEQGETPSKVAAELRVAPSTLRQERDAQGQRQEQLVAELQQAAVALAELKLLLDQADQAAGRAAG
jgi:transposase-like protein